MLSSSFCTSSISVVDYEGWWIHITENIRPPPLVSWYIMYLRMFYNQYVYFQFQNYRGCIELRAHLSFSVILWCPCLNIPPLFLAPLRAANVVSRFSSSWHTNTLTDLQLLRAWSASDGISCLLAPHTTTMEFWAVLEMSN